MDKTIFIVDDEDMELHGLSGMIRSFGLPLSICGTARNGVEGYRKIMELQPDIVISDVKMPQLDGIEMVRALREKSCSFDLIYISGYQDFTAAQAAINIGAKEFIVKPISHERLLQAVEALCGNTGKNIPVITLSEQEKKQADFLRKLFFASARKDENELTEQAKALDLPVGDSQYVVLSVDIKHIQPSCDTAVFSTLMHEAERLEACIPVKTREETYSILLIFPGIMADSIINDYLEKSGEQIADTLQNARQGSVVVGVSGIGKNITGIATLYQQSLMAVNSRQAGGISRLVFYTEDIELDRQLQKDMPTQFAQVLKDVLDGNRDMVREGMVRNFSAWDEYIPFDAARKYCVELCAYASVLAKRNDLPAEKEDEIYWQLIHAGSMQELQSTAQQYLIRLAEEADKLHIDHNMAITQQLCRLIDEEYQEIRSVDDIARRVYLSESYIRRIFKSQTGTTLMNYLLAVRMKKAVEFLEKPQYKIHEIGLLVGYDNPSHFNMVFKKYYGITPGSYREQFLQRKEGAGGAE